MNGLTTITTKGQVTIPESVRRLLGAQIGDSIYFDRVYPKKRQILVKLVPKDSVNRLFGSLNSKGKYISLQAVREKSAITLAKKYNMK